MSKRLTAALLIGAFAVSSAAYAQGMSFQAVDSDQDGYVSFEEITAAVPTMSEDLFQGSGFQPGQPPGSGRVCDRSAVTTGIGQYPP